MSKSAITWEEDASKHIDKAPFFVRAFARKKVEKAALEDGLSIVTKEFVEKVRNKNRDN